MTTTRRRRVLAWEKERRVELPEQPTRPGVPVEPSGYRQRMEERVLAGDILVHKPPERPRLDIPDEGIELGDRLTLKPDYSVWSEEISWSAIGSIDPETEEFQPAWWIKPAEVLYKAFGPVRQFGMRLMELARSTEGEGLAEQEEMEKQMAEMSASEKIQFIKEYRKEKYAPEGEVAKRYEELPLYKQLLLESPPFIAAGLAGITATAGRAALAPLTQAGRPIVTRIVAETGRVALAPIAGYELAIATGLKYGVGLPIKLAGKAVSVTTRKTFETALDAGLDKWLVRQGIRAEQAPRIIEIFMRANKAWLYRTAQENLIKRMAERRGVAYAARTAAEDTIKQAEPLLLKATKEIEAPKAVVPKPAVKPEVVEAPVEVPVVKPPEVLQPEWAKFWVEVRAMDLTSSEVHKFLGVASVKDWLAQGKTLNQAVADLVPKSEAKNIALDKALIDIETGALTPQYRRLAQNITGKKDIDQMTPDEVNSFIEALSRYPEKRWSPKTGKWIPQPMPITTAIVPENFFGLEFGEPTPVRYLTSQNFYATKLGVSPLTQPLELAKQELDLVFPAWSRAIDSKMKALNRVYKVTSAEKFIALRNNLPTRASSEMAELLNKYEDLPADLVAELGTAKVKLFSWFRNLIRTILNAENQVREILDMPLIPHRKAYFRHVATSVAKEAWQGNYSLPADLAYWSSRIVGKKIFNPMEIQRKMGDDLLGYFSKDLGYVTKAMLWTGLKEIYLSQPLKAFTTQLNVLNKGMMPFSSLSPTEMTRAEGIAVLPASTRKWVEDYVRIVIKGQQTEFDASINRLVTQSGLRGVFDKLLKEFGRSLGTRPITKMAQFSGRLIISATIGTKPRQIIRNLHQSTQNLALYGVRATLKAFLPADKTLTRMLNNSMFLKTYARYEELPTGAMAKVERAWLWLYGKSAIFNARTGMKAAYHGVMPLITNKRYAKLGWADPDRTYKEPRGFLYDSEKENLLREMEFGGGCTQYQYIGMGMPEIFRHKTLIPFTRLQSWWMNYFFKFNREAISRYWNGYVGWNKNLKLPWTMRLNWLKYVILGGAVLTALGYKRSFMRDVIPHWASPAGQFMVGAYSYIIADQDWEREKAKRTMYYSLQAFAPGVIDYKMFSEVWKGERPLSDIFFYSEDFPPDAPTWGIPFLEEEVEFKHRVKEVNTEIPKFREQLGDVIPAEDDTESYTYEMEDLGSDIGAMIRNIPPEKVTKENGFPDIVVMYKDAQELIEDYYEIPAGQRKAFIEQPTPESIQAGAYLTIWGKLKVTGWVSGNPQTLVLIDQLVKEYDIPTKAMPGLVESRKVKEAPKLEPWKAPKRRTLSWER